MVDVKNKKCITYNLQYGCFNYPNEKQRLYCSDCKLKNIVNIMDKKCIACNLKHPCLISQMKHKDYVVNHANQKN